MTDQPLEVRAERAVDDAGAPRLPAPSPAQILAEGIRTGNLNADGIRAMTELVATQRAWDAETAFNRDFAAMKEEIPTLVGDTLGEIKKDGVVVFSWWYDKLPVLMKKVAPFLQRHGFSVSFDANHEGGVIHGACTLRHVLGHSETRRAAAPVGTSNRSSPAHAFIGAQTTAKRLALIAVLGVTPQEEPDENDPGDLISEEQAMELETLIKSSGASKGRFIGYFKIEKVDDLPVKRFAEAKQMLIDKGQR